MPACFLTLARGGADLTDEQLVNQCKQGNEHAFELIVRRYHQHLCNFVHNYAGEEELAQDIVQETFIKMINNIQKFEYKVNTKFSTWLFTIARNTITDEFRKRKIRQTISIEEFEDKINLLEETIEEKAIKNEDKNILKQAIDTLPPELKSIIQLRYYMDLSYKEISTVLASTPEKVKWRLRYAIDKLRKIIGTREVKTDET